jgi:hypothetical protein
MSDTMNLPVALTNDELDQRRDCLANLVAERARVENEKKNNVAEFSKRIKEIESDLYEVAHEIRTRSENRDVVITRRKNFRLGVEEVIRDDTGEIVNSRPLRAEERQMQLGEATVSVMHNDLARRRRATVASLDEEAERAALEATEEASEK